MANVSPVLFDAPAEEFERRALADHAAARPGHVTRADIRLSLHEDLAAIERDWCEFQARAHGAVFQTYEWLATWHRHIGVRRGVRPAIVIGRDGRGEIMLLLPLAVEHGRLARRLTWLGAEFCDYNAPLLARDFSMQVSIARFAQLWAEVLLRLRSHPRFSFDLVQLQQMPGLIGPQRNPLLHMRVTRHPNNAFVVSLTDDWGKLYAKRSSATRRHDRAKRNKLAEHGPVACVHATTAEEIARTLEILIEQKSRWFAEMGVSDMFEKPGCREFFFDIATNPQTRHLTHVSRLEVGGTTLATSFGLSFGERFYYVQASYDRGSKLARFAPGMALLHDLMRFAIGRGLRLFDLSIGSERYKQEWCDTELNLYDHVAAVNLRGACAALPLMLTRQVKRWIKSNPRVWTTFRKARAFAGSLPPFRR
jgi:CelD/BcsL family acetyltransferase involved in cellulose biosynthesis